MQGDYYGQIDRDVRRRQGDNHARHERPARYEDGHLREAGDRFEEWDRDAGRDSGYRRPWDSDYSRDKYDSQPREEARDPLKRVQERLQGGRGDDRGRWNADDDRRGRGEDDADGRHSRDARDGAGRARRQDDGGADRTHAEDRNYEHASRGDDWREREEGGRERAGRSEEWRAGGRDTGEESGMDRERNRRGRDRGRDWSPDSDRSRDRQRPDDRDRQRPDDRDRGGPDDRDRGRFEDRDRHRHDDRDRDRERGEWRRRRSRSRSPDRRRHRSRSRTPERITFPFAQLGTDQYDNSISETVIVCGLTESITEIMIMEAFREVVPVKECATMTYKYKDPNAVNQMVQQEFTAYYALVDLFSVEEAQSCMQHAAEAGGYFNVHGVSTVLYYSQITAEENVAQSSSRRRRQRERERRTDAVLSDTSSMPMPRSAMPTAPHDWLCTHCNCVNFARRMQCFSCQAARPKEPQLVDRSGRPVDTNGSSSTLQQSNMYAPTAGGVSGTDQGALNGFVLVEATGYWYNASTGHFYDPTSQTYLIQDPNTMAYYYFDNEKQEYVPFSNTSTAVAPSATTDVGTASAAQPAAEAAGSAPAATANGGQVAGSSGKAETGTKGADETAQAPLAVVPGENKVLGDVLAQVPDKVAAAAGLAVAKKKTVKTADKGQGLMATLKLAKKKKEEQKMVAEEALEQDRQDARSREERARQAEADKYAKDFMDHQGFPEGHDGRGRRRDDHGNGRDWQGDRHGDGRGGRRGDYEGRGGDNARPRDRDYHRDPRDRGSYERSREWGRDSRDPGDHGDWRRREADGGNRGGGAGSDWRDRDHRRGDRDAFRGPDQGRGSRRSNEDPGMDPTRGRAGASGGPVMSSAPTLNPAFFLPGNAARIAERTRALESERDAVRKANESASGSVPPAPMPARAGLPPSLANRQGQEMTPDVLDRVKQWRKAQVDLDVEKGRQMQKKPQPAVGAGTFATPKPMIRKDITLPPTQILHKPTRSRPPTTSTSGNATAPAASTASTAPASSNEMPREDPNKQICYLCRRKFATPDKYDLHCSKSQLHLNNLKQWKEKMASGGGLGSTGQGGSYVDRAAERRRAMGVSDRTGPPNEKALFPPPHGVRAQASAPALAHAADPGSNPLGSSNVGSKMLKTMGWSEGEGLGKQKDGRTDAIEVRQRSQREGLGMSRGDTGFNNPAYRPDPNDSYNVQQHKKMLARVEEMDQGPSKRLRGLS